MTQPHSQPSLPPLDLPPLPDEAVAALMDFLHDIVFQFEGRYFGQLQRYYADHTPEDRDPPNLSDAAVDFDDPLPF
ncbi:hypothetical protein [Thiorhodococcus minor]|uniref:Uncharacterized protein n=1 Tax=Thiorhodococcus minor TaxID=57489 RepID=A0A6M0K7V6_9GAMM|nr:hypothetical protein [Thiorhodococcus minor]NEV65404.1 hypothetical protein [Thiorhodococcus minor]